MKSSSKSPSPSVGSQQTSPRKSPSRGPSPRPRLSVDSGQPGHVEWGTSELSMAASMSQHRPGHEARTMPLSARSQHHSLLVEPGTSVLAEGAPMCTPVSPTPPPPMDEPTPLPELVDQTL